MSLWSCKNSFESIKFDRRPFELPFFKIKSVTAILRMSSERNPNFEIRCQASEWSWKSRSCRRHPRAKGTKWSALVPLKLQLAFRWLVHWRLLAVSLAFAGSKGFQKNEQFENIWKPMNIKLVNAETFKDQGCFVWTSLERTAVSQL